ncbi:GlxA family transcriptional regulator [Kutzneria buriramensis]|uniref:Transcriptional regulator GlxA family with amidase domain n=1 Tax=Kutzneria buriramensis TaxID=1045776 RepID=A0A3E0I569_9PSEU|nr:helix-turn-helix domain-containing protein [Kutzneria buriramensis]REH53882.1 transcriptional regulator GlxA family with amidase domain [Kutzneria buriramensis]
MSRDKATVAVLMFDRAPMFETSVPISVFGVDRTSTGAPAFTLLPVAGEPGPLTTTGGVQVVPPHGLDALDRAGIVVAPSWRNTAERPPEPALRALRAAHEDGALVVGQCMGAFVLAAAGLLDGRRAATHWFHAPALAANYPLVTVDPGVLYEDDGDVITSAGTAAGIDACLHVVRRLWGASAATAIARRMIVAPQRSGGQAQYIDHPILELPDGDRLGAAMVFALEHLDEPLEVDTLAAHAHLSRRTFDRQFRAVVGISPLQWLLHQRILHAQRMLEQTDLPVDVIARRVGFTAGVSLRPSFRRIVGVSPQDYRNTFQPKEIVDDSRRGRGRANGHAADRPAGRGRP